MTLCARCGHTLDAHRVPYGTHHRACFVRDCLCEVFMFPDELRAVARAASERNARGEVRRFMRTEVSDGST